jgi:hypothetical protein
MIIQYFPFIKLVLKFPWWSEVVDFITCYRQANQSAVIHVKWMDQACTVMQMLIACWFLRQVTSSVNANRATMVLVKCVQVWQIYCYWYANKNVCFWRMVSSEVLRHVALVRTDVSEEPSAPFYRVTRIGELGTTLAATSNRCTLQRNAWYFFLRNVSSYKSHMA